MQLRRIYSVFLRHFLPSIREFYRLIDILYWPLFDIVLWGFTGVWVQGVRQEPQMILTLLTALVFWQVVGRSQMEISLGLIEELWSHNMVNLFSTPLSIGEWLIAMLTLSFFKSLFTLAFGASLIWMIYDVSIMYLGSLIFPLFVLFFMSGLCFGFLTIAILIRIGQRAQSLIWVIGWIAAPFSGVFYPVAVLPSWAQYISYALPTTYLFEGIRLLIATGNMPSYFWRMNLLLTVLYGSALFFLFMYMYRRSKIQGLARLQAE